MCNEVCSCCERDICKCLTRPAPTLNDFIKQAIKEITHIQIDDYSSLWYFEEDMKTFYIETKRVNHIKHEKMINRVLKLGHKIKDPDYDKHSHNIYTVFQFVE